VEREGVKFTLQGETQYDSQRKGIHYIGFKLTFPIGEPHHIRQRLKFTAIEKMMTRDIVRDVDIQSEKAGKKRIHVATKTKVEHEDKRTFFVELSDTDDGPSGDGTAEHPHRLYRGFYDKGDILRDVAHGGDFDDVAVINRSGNKPEVEYHPMINVPPLRAEELAPLPPVIHGAPPPPPAAAQGHHRRHTLRRAVVLSGGRNNPTSVPRH
jgi:hypothetical protein